MTTIENFKMTVETLDGIKDNIIEKLNEKDELDKYKIKFCTLQFLSKISRQKLIEIRDRKRVMKNSEAEILIKALNL